MPHLHTVTQRVEGKPGTGTWCSSCSNTCFSRIPFSKHNRVALVMPLLTGFLGAQWSSVSLSWNTVFPCVGSRVWWSGAQASESCRPKPTMLPLPAPRVNALPSRTLLDAQVQRLLHRAAWRPEVRLIKSPHSQIHWCEVHQPFPPPAFTVVSQLGERQRAAFSLTF